jgi:hypothetical protein
LNLRRLAREILKLKSVRFFENFDESVLADANLKNWLDANRRIGLTPFEELA